MLHEPELHEEQESSFVTPGEENKEMVFFTLLLLHFGHTTFSFEMSYL